MPRPAPATGGGTDRSVRPDRSWPAVLGALMAATALSADDTAWAMDEIMAGNAAPSQLAAFAVLMRAKGETPGELAGLVRTMLARATPLRIEGDAVDVVGTGADRAHTVNISTMAALVVAGSGRRVVKHGNRAASSACGSADVLEELGVAIDLPPAGVVHTVGSVGIGFCFAPVFHPGMRHAGPVRGQLGVPTAFNFLGPLTNPARIRAGAVGCADRRMAPAMAAVLAERGDSALVFRGDDGLDELTTTTTSSVWVATGGTVTETSLDPVALGIAAVAPEALRGGDRRFNAAAVHSVLAGEGRGGPREAVLLNAAAGIAAHDGLGELPLADALARGLRIATEAVDSGSAAGLLDRWVVAGAEARILES